MLLTEPIKFEILKPEVTKWLEVNKSEWLKYAHLDGDNSDVGFDLRSAEDLLLPSRYTLAIGTGIALQPPHGYYIEVCARSGMGKNGLLVTAGQIDPGYRGEIKILLHNSNEIDVPLHIGDRLAQGVLRPALQTHFELSLGLSSSLRAASGLGSTGIK